MPACTSLIASALLADWIEGAKLVISLLTLASIIIAFLSYRANLRKQAEDRGRDRDKELLGQAQKSLQWAYETLTADGQTIPPDPSRLNWLTAARHLLRQQRIAAEISTDTYKTVYAEVAEYWRHKFYLALSHERLANSAYFMDMKAPDWPENIQPLSALVVVNFSQWNEQMIDPLDLVDKQELIESGAATKGPYVGFGLKSYLDRLDRAKHSLPQKAPK